jgi:hypothetical protein
VPSEDDENSPTKLRYKVKVAKAQLEVHDLKTQFMAEENKLMRGIYMTYLICVY